MNHPSSISKVHFYTPSPLTLNSSKKRAIATNIFCAKNLWQLSTGLMFRKLKEREAMIFLFKKPQTELKIHMFCVFHPIDILFCKVISREPLQLEIKDITLSLMPFAQYSSSIAPCDAFIELPAGSARSLTLGEVISLR